MAKTQSSKNSAKSLKKHRSVFEYSPQKNVLLLSCMDVRLLDNTVHFMNELNLQNRYDQVIFAGASLGTGQLSTMDDSYTPSVELKWKKIFFHHLDVAINGLEREIKDIFILEHLDCGAYAKLNPDLSVRAHYVKYSRAGDFSKMEKYHRTEATSLADAIEAYCAGMREKPPTDTFNPGRWEGIRVRCLLMDLTGRVRDLV